MRCLSCGREAPDEPFCEWCGKPLKSVGQSAAGDGHTRRRNAAWATMAVVSYLAIVCAAVESVLRQSPLRWWVTIAAVAYLAFCAAAWRFLPNLWRQLNWASRAVLNVVVLLALAGTTAWRHGRLEQASSLRGQPSIAASVRDGQPASSATASSASPATVAPDDRQQRYDQQVASLDSWTASADDRISRLPASATDVAALAHSLSQPQAAFEYVRDNIALEPYPGVLKGAQATLATRGGSDLDRALLLIQLLGSEGITGAQIVHGQLSAAQVDTLLKQITSKPDAVDLIAGSLPKPTSPAAVDPKSLARSRKLDQTIADNYRVVEASLKSANLEIPRDDAGKQAKVLADHYWVRFVQDGKSIDLDPAFSTAAFGQSFAVAADSFTADNIRSDLFQKVSIVLTADYLQGNALHSEEVLRGDFTSVDLWGKNIRFVLTPTGQRKPGSEWQALLRVGDNVITGQKVRVGASDQAPPNSALAGSGSGMLGGVTGGMKAAPGAAGFGPIESNESKGTEGHGTLARVRLGIETEAPGLPPSETQKVILDRLTANQSSLDPAISDELAGQLLTQVWDGTAAVGPVHPYFVLQNAILPWIHAVADIGKKALAARYLGQRSDPSALPGAGLSPDLLTFTLASSIAEHALQKHAFPGLRAYYERPRILFTRHGFGIADWWASPRVATYREGIDLANSPFAFVGSSDASRALAMQWGIADTALELELGARRGVPLNTVALMSAAAAERVSVNAVGPQQKTLLNSLALPAPMKSLLEQELAGRNTLVAPSGFVPLAGRKTYGWWSVQPGGYAIGKMELGGSQAIVEHIELAQNLADWPQTFAQLHGMVLACYFAVSSAVLNGAQAADPGPCVANAVCAAVSDFANEEAWFLASPSGGEAEEQSIFEQLEEIYTTNAAQELTGAKLLSFCKGE